MVEKRTKFSKKINKRLRIIILIFLFFFTNICASSDLILKKEAIKAELQKYIYNRLNGLFDINNEYKHAEKKSADCIFESIETGIKKIQKIKINNFTNIAAKDFSGVLTKQDKINADQKLFQKIKKIISKCKFFTNNSEEHWSQNVKELLVSIVGKKDLQCDEKHDMYIENDQFSIKIQSPVLMNFILLLPTVIGLYDTAFIHDESKIDQAIHFGKNFYYKDKEEGREAFYSYYHLLYSWSRLLDAQSVAERYKYYINFKNLYNKSSENVQILLNTPAVNRVLVFFKNVRINEFERGMYWEDAPDRIESLDGEIIFQEVKKIENNHSRWGRDFINQLWEYIMQNWEKSLIVLICCGIISVQNMSRIPYLKNISNPLKS